MWSWRGNSLPEWCFEHAAPDSKVLRKIRTGIPLACIQPVSSRRDSDTDDSGNEGSETEVEEGSSRFPQTGEQFPKKKEAKRRQRKVRKRKRENTKSKRQGSDEEGDAYSRGSRGVLPTATCVGDTIKSLRGRVYYSRLLLENCEFRVGDSCHVQSGDPARPYTARIDEITESTKDFRLVQVMFRWYFKHSDTVLPQNVPYDPRELYISDLRNDNDASTIIYGDDVYVKFLTADLMKEADPTCVEGEQAQSQSGSSRRPVVPENGNRAKAPSRVLTTPPPLLVPEGDSPEEGKIQYYCRFYYDASKGTLRPLTQDEVDKGNATFKMRKVRRKL
eukprot:Rmarinus@m.981